MQQSNGQITVDAIIPTFKPDETLYRLLAALQTQSCPVSKVWVVNTREEGSPDLKAVLEARYGTWVSVNDIPVAEFDHGKARNYGASFSSADYLLFMTQDAVPADDRMVESLLAAFAEESVAVAYARQLPRPNAANLERLSREFNYPNVSQTKCKSDLPKLGIKTYFCSNVCALYSKPLFDHLSRFKEGMIFNEDMLFAAAAIQADYSVVYQASARVVHSHDYSAERLFERYFDIGVSQRQHPTVFENVASSGEGSRFVSWMLQKLIHPVDVFGLFCFVMQTLFKGAGFLLGKNYDKLPLALCRKFSSFPAYWDRNTIVKR